jgi:hypothetical protein
MALTKVEFVSETKNTVQLRVVTPGVPDQLYRARKSQPAIPPGDSLKIVVCNEDGTPKPPVTYMDGSSVAPYIGGHLEGFAEIMGRFTWPAS